MGQAIMVTSGKGGSGTTTFAINIAAVLANSGAKVLVFDMNIGLRNDDIYLGVEDRILFDVGDVVSDVCGLRKAIVQTDNENLDLLPGTQCKGIAGFSQLCITNLLLDLKDAYDYVIVDCPVTIGKTLDYVAADCEKALLIATPDYVSMRNTDAVRQKLAKGFIDIFLAVNRINENSFSDIIQLSDITKAVPVPLIGVMAEDGLINAFNNRGIPVVNSSSGAIVKAFIEITARLVA